ncbi:hypothetical protein BDR04DRAFT_1018495 [Suillus decipiens]|nr:hypothetical protein BDR04DRAFT_1018495 [Suillus decipiens]
MDSFHDSLHKILPVNNNKKLVVRWMPGHVRIPGNKKADEMAKRAARRDVSEGKLLPKSLRMAANNPIMLPISKSSTLQQFQEHIKEEAAKVMHLSPCFAALQTIDPTTPSKHFAELIDQFLHHHTSLLFQLRTRHVPHNKHLHCIAKSETATCQQCNEGNQSVHHFLLTFPAYTRQCNMLRQELEMRAHHMKHILNDAECLKSLFTFIAKTKIFEPVFRDVSPPKDKNDKNS